LRDFLLEVDENVLEIQGIDAGMENSNQGASGRTGEFSGGDRSRSA
jgi:hypothetical protein